MKEEKNDIEELFSSKLKNAEMDVPDAVWSRLSEQLTAQKTVNDGAVSPKRVLLWTLVSVASVLLLLLIINRKQDVPLVNKQLHSQTDMQPIESEHANHPQSATLANNSIIITHSKSFQKEHLTSGNISNVNSPQSNNQSLPEVFVTNQEVDKTAMVSEQQDVQKEKNKDSELDRKTTEFSNAAKNETDKLFADNNVKVTKQKNRRKLNIAAGGGLGLASQSMTTNQVLSLDVASSNSELRSESFRSSQSTYQLDHAFPVSFNVGITKSLNDFINLELGLSYSYLYSKQKGSSSATTRQIQQFYYVGIPIAVNCRIANWNKFRLGVLVGGSIQKDIAGRIKEDVESSLYGENSSQKIHQKYFQPSLNADLHISYSISKKLSLYGKIGGVFYFDMNDNYSTIYSDKSFLPDIGFGISYNIDY